MAYVHAFRTRAIIMQSPESSTELLNEAVTRVARIESGMSRIEQAMTLLRFALERLPEDDAPRTTHAVRNCRVLPGLSQNEQPLICLRDRNSVPPIDSFARQSR
ncbi:hypothetical protein CR51_09865 [Caballeronia megalochromosomata]|nr:hypothetical protein CR51_09865 [Caballeronia megalochromosomata]